MLTRIELERFRGFSSLSADLRPVSVLLGPNSSGKSSVLQAVRLACAVLSWVLKDAGLHPVPGKDGWITLWRDHPIRDDEAFLPTTHAEELFAGQSTEDGLSIKLEFEAEQVVQALYVQLSYGLNQALKLTVQAKSDKAMAAIQGVPPKSKHVSRLLRDALRDKEPIPIFIPAFYGVTRHELYSSSAHMERLLAEGEQGRMVRNLVARLDGATLKDLNDLLRLSLGSTVTKSTSGHELDQIEHLSVSFRDTNGDLELSSAGTGLIALIALFSSLKWYQARAAQGRSLLFLLDEPEAHLHPRLQGDTGARLADLITGFGAQVILATHSVEMINRLGERDDAVLIGVDRSATNTATELSSSDKVREALGAFCDLTPFVGLQLLISRRVLFHEGKTDKEIFEGAARAMFANDPQKLAKFKLWTLASLTGADNAEAKSVLKKAIAPLFNAPGQKTKSSDRVKLARVLDRDYHRTPILGPAEVDPATNIEELDVVWSRHSIESLFLDTPILHAWLRASLAGHAKAPSDAKLLRWIEEAIAAANEDPRLCKDAAAHLASAWLRDKPLGQAAQTQAFIRAVKDAEDAVKNQPEIWQRGHDRATFILDHTRKRLDKSVQNRVPSTIDAMIRRGKPGSLVAPSTLIPAEVRSVLDFMVQ